MNLSSTLSKLRGLRHVFREKKVLDLFLSAFLFLLLFLGIPKTIFAGEVVINEFLVDPDSEQWVELYNKGTESVDISGWFIDDDGRTQKFTIPSGTTINPSEFKVFESGNFNLDWASGDTAKLLNGASIEDSYSYDIGPGENNTYGRQTDGVGDWVVFNSPTKSSTNNSSTPVPTPTPTPTPTSVPTNTPTPTKIPTPTKVPTPTKNPTPTKSPSSTPTPTKSSMLSPTPTLKPTIASSVSPTSSKKLSAVSPSIAVLGESTENSTKNLKEEEEISRTTSKNSFPVIFIVLGIVFISACGILGFWKFRKKGLTTNE